MNNNKCGNCGFLNFETDSACKRCKSVLNSVSGLSDNPLFNSYMTGQLGRYQSAPGYAQPVYAPSYFPGPVAPLPRTSKNGVTNTVLLALVGVVVLVAAGIGVLWKFGNSTPRIYAWQEYQARDDSYTFMMPAKPLEKVIDRSSPEGELKMYMKIANTNNLDTFIIGHADYPEEFTEIEPQEMLELTTQGAVRTSGATLLSKKEITLEGHPGLELEMQPPGRLAKRERSVTRIYWVAPRIYLMLAAGPKSPETNASMEKFFGSLKLRKKQTKGTLKTQATT